jgi:hypothetical protein
MERLRIGTLSTAQITPPALIEPARRLAEATVTAVAARDRSRGQMRAQNFVHPHVRFRVTTKAGQHTESIGPDPGPAETTYLGQLRAFTAAVLCGEPFPTTPEHAIGTMELIDDIYRAAGLAPRPTAR